MTLTSDNTLHAVPTGNQPTYPDTKNVSPTSASMSPPETLTATNRPPETRYLPH
jgi:hypothetical protein